MIQEFFEHNNNHYSRDQRNLSILYDIVFLILEIHSYKYQWILRKFYSLLYFLTGVKIQSPKIPTFWTSYSRKYFLVWCLSVRFQTHALFSDFSLNLSEFSLEKKRYFDNITSQIQNYFHGLEYHNQTMIKDGVQHLSMMQFWQKNIPQVKNQIFYQKISVQNWWTAATSQHIFCFRILAKKFSHKPLHQFSLYW
jgi:hypothetical protein